MYLRRSILFSLFVVLVGAGHAFAQKQPEIVAPKNYRPPVLTTSETLQSALNAAVAKVLAAPRAMPLKENEIAVTVIDLRDATGFQWASFRGEERVYPASVVKMFYLAALERQLEDKKITMTAELERGLRDMIVDSSNEATQYILDVLTDTSSGAELPQKQFDAWQYKRNRVNRWLTSMGYSNINVNQKTFCEDAYGIEQQSRGYAGKNRNMLTTNATARMLAEIVTGNIAPPERTARMMKLLERDPFKPTADPDSQATGFTGIALIDRKMTDAKLWSKAGWTSKTRHDAAYIETADGLKFVIAIFTENHATARDIIPAVAGSILDTLSSAHFRTM